MIKVRNKILFIPEDEVRLASGDNNSVVREFHIDRVQPDGVDLANLLFKLDLRYADTNTTDTALLDKVVTDDEIVLTFTATSAVTAHAGAFFCNIRAFDSDGFVHWSSFQGVFYLENTIGDGADKTQLAELEALETRIDAKTEALDSAENSRVTAENARVEAEKARVTAESARVDAETARENAFTEATNKFNETQASAEAADKVSKSWAVGPNGSIDTSGTDTNNSKYYSEQSKSSADAAAKSESNAKSYMETTSAIAAGGIHYRGALTYTEVLSLIGVATGDMYNITEDYSNGDVVYRAGDNAIAVVAEDGTVTWQRDIQTISDVSILNAGTITDQSGMYPDYAVDERMSEILGKIKKYLTDLKEDKSAAFTISHASDRWVSTTVNSTTYYVYIQTISAVYTETPDVMLAPSSGLIPTDAEETAYGQVVQATVDPEALVLKLYATSVPNADFVINVRGVK